jgi:hypothetical protein
LMVYGVGVLVRWFWCLRLFGFPDLEVIEDEWWCGLSEQVLL